MVVLKADNRSLTKGAKYSYTDANYLSGRTTMLVANSADFTADDYVLLGEFGAENAEIVQVDSVTAATHTLTFKTATKFSHPESTRVTILPYNQVRFYHTSTATFSATGPLTGYQDVTASDIFSRYTDTTNSTGFGWFIFYNSTTAKATSNSNAIPYANFGQNSVKRILDNFYSLLNNNELKLVSYDDALAWLNEAYSIVRNELNLVEQEYNASDEQTISVSSGTSEYALPSDFSNVISLWDGTDKVYVEYIPLSEEAEWDRLSSNTVRYYLRGDYIGFSPQPTGSKDYTLRYGTKPSALTSYYDNVTLPDNNYYMLKDYMMYRAAQKLNKPNGPMFMENFMMGVNRMKLTSVKRNANRDSFSVDGYANV